MHEDKRSGMSSSTLRPGRRVFVATVAAALVAPARAKADLFGGDIPVLLAQLEQQFQMVSHAISTVQNLVRTVEELQTVVSNSKTLLEHAGDNGIKGILNAAQGSVSMLRGVVGDLKRVNSDITWWQRQLDTSKTLTPQNASALSRQRHEWNMKTLESASTALEAFKTVDDSYEDLEQSQDIVKAQRNTSGVVGQLQLMGRQNYYTQKSLLQLATTQALGMQVLTNAEASRAFDKEVRHKNTENLLKDYSKPGTPDEVMTELP